MVAQHCGSYSETLVEENKSGGRGRGGGGDSWLSCFSSMVDKLAVVCVIMSMSKCMCACMHTLCVLHACVLYVRACMCTCVRECMFNTIIYININFLLDEEDITVKEPLRQMVYSYMIHVHVFL